MSNSGLTAICPPFSWSRPGEAFVGYDGRVGEEIDRWAVRFLGRTFLVLWWFRFLLPAGLGAVPLNASSCTQAATLAAEGHLRQAIQSYEVCLETSPSPQNLWSLSKVYSRAGKFPEAIHAARKAVALTAGSPDAYVQLSLLLIQAHRYADAVPELGRAILLRPGFARAHQLLAMCLFHLKQYELAAIEAEQARRAAPSDPASNFILGSSYLNLKLYHRAISPLQRALAVTGSLQIRVVLGEAYLGVGQSASALHEFLAARSSHFPIPGLDAEIGAAYDALDKPTLAVAYYQKALAESPNDFEANYYLARFNRRHGNFRRASFYLSRAARAAPNDPDVLYESAELAIHNGNNSRAQQLLKKVLVKTPRDLEARVLLAQVEFRLGEVAAARREQAMVMALGQSRDQAFAPRGHRLNNSRASRRPNRDRASGSIQSH